jgi:hypothetical protein
VKRTAAILILLTTIIGAFPTRAWSQEMLDPTFSVSDDRNGADVVGAFTGSFKLLLMEHAWRVAFQEKTRRELGGNFWTDYRRSVRMPGQWADTDSWWVNYIGHPIHGAAAGYIWLDRDPRAPVENSVAREYWTSRGRAAAWAAAYSLQFEIGPFSEASIGNVGLRPETTGWVDHVVTPAGAFGWIVVEDALDRFVARRIEARLRNPLLRLPVRLALNPARVLSNTATGRAPWHRDGRPLNWR